MKIHERARGAQRMLCGRRAVKGMRFVSPAEFRFAMGNFTRKPSIYCSDCAEIACTIEMAEVVR